MAFPKATLSELQAVRPDQKAVIDSKNESEIYSYTEKLKLVLILCEQVVIAAYSVAQYVPDLSSSSEYSQFWKEDIIPNLVESLTQDVKARSVMSHAFESIGSLAITIRKGAEIVKESKASPKSLEIVKASIPAALKELENYIDEISNMKSSAVQPLGKGNIFQFIGSKAVDYIDDKANIELQINLSYDKQNAIISELRQKQGELNRFDYLMTATEKRLPDTAKDGEMAKARAKELGNLNANLEQTIQNFLTKMTENKTGFPFWKWLSVGSQNYSLPNNERKFYESVILARMTLIKGELDDAAAAAKIEKQFTKDLSEYNAKYDQVKKEMAVTFNSATDKMTAIQNDIVNLLKKREQINQFNNQIQVEELTGQNGDLLIRCLTIAQAFSQLFEKDSIIYGPLVTVLHLITDIVRDDVELLSGTDADIFVAIESLLKSVDFLTLYTSRLDGLLSVSAEYPGGKQF